jgi:hypothetical protein
MVFQYDSRVLPRANYIHRNECDHTMVVVGVVTVLILDRLHANICRCHLSPFPVKSVLAGATNRHHRARPPVPPPSPTTRAAAYSSSPPTGSFIFFLPPPKPQARPPRSLQATTCLGPKPRLLLLAVGRRPASFRRAPAAPMILLDVTGTSARRSSGEATTRGAVTFFPPGKRAPRRDAVHLQG